MEKGTICILSIHSSLLLGRFQSIRTQKIHWLEQQRNLCQCMKENSCTRCLCMEGFSWIDGFDLYFKQILAFMRLSFLHPLNLYIQIDEKMLYKCIFDGKLCCVHVYMCTTNLSLKNPRNIHISFEWKCVIWQLTL